MTDTAALQASIVTETGFVTALRQAQGSGVKRVTYADRTVEYQSVADMMAAEAAALARIADASRQIAGRRRNRQVLFVAGKGL